MPPENSGALSRAWPKLPAKGPSFDEMKRTCFVDYVLMCYSIQEIAAVVKKYLICVCKTMRVLNAVSSTKLNAHYSSTHIFSNLLRTFSECSTLAF